MKYYKPLEEQLAYKVQNNAPCPCGKTTEALHYVKGKTEPMKAKVRTKYKKCCKGKALFFKTEEDKQHAEYHILEREKRYKKLEAELNKEQ